MIRLFRWATLFFVLTLLCGTRVGLAQEESVQAPQAPQASQEQGSQEELPQGCQACHGEALARDMGSPLEQLNASVHADLSCDDCHASITIEDVVPTAPLPHGEVEPVNCGECHDDEAAAYQKHGKLTVGQDDDLPKCWDCHGHHDVLNTSDSRSRVHPVNLPATCISCHTNVDLLKKHKVLRAGPVTVYKSSVHGQATRKGIYVSATCNDCHSAVGPNGERTAHRVLSPRDPESTTYHFNIPDTCGQCHKSIVRDYWEGIHGQFVKRGELDAPVCTTCHGEHGIVSPSDPASPVSPTHVAQQTCTPCHESAVLNEKYGLPGGRLASYIDSYHGLKSKAGDTTVANCASCHGAHRILPSKDPQSSINAANLRGTCGECHPGITTELAQTRIHETGAGFYSGWSEIFRQIYIVLIIATIGLMLLHNLADWLRRVRDAKKAPHVQRLSTNEVMQHWGLMLSFIVLVLSGFSLRFSETWWVQDTFGWEGGFGVRGIVHRSAAVVMVLTSIWHIGYWLTQRGRKWVRDMMVSKADFVHVWHNILYFLGYRSEEARYKRFSYMEKAEYWALVWGTLVMTVTGVFLWYDNLAVRFGLSKGFLDVILVIHYYEAWLATLAILVWHLYGVMFKPSVYPMNTAWLAGRMPKAMYDHEHPEGPRLKGRRFRPRFEEEIEESSPVGQLEVAKGHA